MRDRSTVRNFVILCFGIPLAIGATALPVLDNYDIRLSTEKTSVITLQNHIALHRAPRDQELLVDERMQDARQGLQDNIPGFRVIDSVETGAPEVIGVSGGNARLSVPSEIPRDQSARRFVEDNSWLFGLSQGQAAALKIDANYSNPAGNLSWVRFKQTIGGLNVFRGYLTLAFTPAGEIARTTGQLAAAVPESLVPPVPVLSAAQGVAAAAAEVGFDLNPESLEVSEGAPGDINLVFKQGPFVRDIEIELIYFPLTRGVVELAWSMTLWGENDSYLAVVSAEDGALLFRKNMTESDTYTYEVYTSDSPAPLSPGPNDPSHGTQGALVSRTPAAVESQNVNGDPWLPSGLADPQKVTDGNNVEAGLDIDGTNGVDAPVPASNPVTNTFSYSYNPAPGDPSPGDAPTGVDYRNGSVVNLFYWTNRFHDVTYDLGFTEQAFNFQQDNFGRGGLGGDRISAEAQDSAGTNNANFSTPADGGRGRMQMFIWTSPAPDRDGSLDADIVIHELTHGLSNRLHGNAAGLGSNMSRSMGEGWGDFYAHAILSEPSDPLNGVYTIGGYSLFDGFGAIGTSNFYYGIRRFPKAVMSFTGGPQNRPHNPLTFADIDQTQIDTTDGAFPQMSGPHISSTADQVHAAGEVWSTALWEARGLLISRLGHVAGNQLMLQLVTDGMKLDPINPTFLQARDSILAADCAAFGGANEIDLWTGFATRGMGYGAEVLVEGSGGSTRVVEAFDGISSLPTGNVELIGATCEGVPVSHTPPNPGNTLTFSVPLINPFCGTQVTGVSASISGGPVVAYGTLNPGQTVSRDLTYTIPPDTCGDLVQLEIQIVSNIGNSTQVIEVQVGPTGVEETSFVQSEIIDIPAGYPTTTSGPASPYPSVVTVAGITDPVLGVTLTLNALSHEWVSDVDILLESPTGETMIVLSDAWSGSNDPPIVATLKFEDAAVDTPPTSGLPPASGAFKPVNHSSGDVFDAPAPVGPYSDPPLSGFAGVNANGDWKLWIDDDAGSDPGQLLGGWTLGILTAGPVDCDPCAAGLIFADGFESNDTTEWTLP